MHGDGSNTMIMLAWAIGAADVPLLMHHW